MGSKLLCKVARIVLVGARGLVVGVSEDREEKWNWDLEEITSWLWNNVSIFGETLYPIWYGLTPRKL